MKLKVVNIGIVPGKMTLDVVLLDDAASGDFDLISSHDLMGRDGGSDTGSTLSACVSGLHAHSKASTERFFTNDVLARKVLEAKPSIACHACRNSKGPKFGDVISHTSIPHLFEHLIIDEQLRFDSTSTDKVFAGNTRWVDRKNGKARIEVNFENDTVALKAQARALDFLNALL